MEVDFVEEVSQCLTSFLFVEYATSYLRANGFVEIDPKERTPKTFPEKYFMKINQNRLIVVNGNENKQCLIANTEISGDTFIAKANDFEVSEGFCKVRVTKSNLVYRPLNRPLAVACHVFFHDEKGQVKSEVFRTNYPVAVSCVNESLKLNEEDIGVLYLTLSNGSDVSYVMPQHSKPLLDVIEKELGIKEEQIIDFEAHFIDCNKPKYVGTEKQWIAGYNIINSVAAVATLHAISEADTSKATFIGHFSAHSDILESDAILGQLINKFENCVIVNRIEFNEKQPSNGSSVCNLEHSCREKNVYRYNAHLNDMRNSDAYDVININDIKNYTAMFKESIAKIDDLISEKIESKISIEENMLMIDNLLADILKIN